MIAYLKGEIIQSEAESVILETGGVGYEINMAGPSAAALPEGTTAEVYISQSFSQYDGVLLYGFLNLPEKKLFELFRTEIPKTGAKKALEFLGKALRSLPDFKAAIASGDERVLKGIFGFSPKTSEKMITALREKIDTLEIAGETRIQTEARNPKLTQVLTALASLGYTSAQARHAIAELERGSAPDASVEDMIKQSLRILSK
ncbi:MAG: Holliday junction branch migration protein RuvA [Elusimicrobiaceae bacterium]|jgi:Holliday junction DNA helicase RuvA